jgi:C1A family cysteine protease
MNLIENLSPSLPDSRDRIAKLNVPDVLPSSVDLKSDVFEVEDQGVLGTCTANAGCSALELLYNKRGTPVDLSRLYVYWYARKLGNLTGDSGAYPRDMCRALKNYGVCYEKNWLYNVTNLEKEPDNDLLTEAEQFKIVSYEQIVGNRLSQIKAALASGMPVFLTIQVHPGFAKLSKNWKEHTWDYKTSDTNPLEGYHAVLIIGYDDESKRLLVENSWGPHWADGGFFGIPYDMIDTPAFGETWLLTPNYNISWSKDNLPETKSNGNYASIIAVLLLCGFLYYFLK